MAKQTIGTSDDPIIAAIAGHRAALAAWQGADRDDDAARRKALDVERAAFFRVFAAPPTTSAGVAAWLTRLASPEHEEGGSIIASIGEYFEEDFHANVVRQLQAAAAVLAAEVRS
jgi:hypothetical protein